MADLCVPGCPAAWFDLPHPHLQSCIRFVDLPASTPLFQQPHRPGFFLPRSQMFHQQDWHIIMSILLTI